MIDLVMMEAGMNGIWRDTDVGIDIALGFDW